LGVNPPLYPSANNLTYQADLEVFCS